MTLSGSLIWPYTVPCLPHTFRQVSLFSIFFEHCCDCWTRCREDRGIDSRTVHREHFPGRIEETYRVTRCKEQPACQSYITADITKFLNNIIAVCSRRQRTQLANKLISAQHEEEAKAAFEKKNRNETRDPKRKRNEDDGAGSSQVVKIEPTMDFDHCPPVFPIAKDDPPPNWTGATRRVTTPRENSPYTFPIEPVSRRAQASTTIAQSAEDQAFDSKAVDMPAGAPKATLFELNTADTPVAPPKATLFESNTSGTVEAPMEKMTSESKATHEAASAAAGTGFPLCKSTKTLTSRELENHLWMTHR